MKTRTFFFASKSVQKIKLPYSENNLKSQKKYKLTTKYVGVTKFEQKGVLIVPWNHDSR